LLRSEDGVMDTFSVNAVVVPRQEQQAFIPIYTTALQAGCTGRPDVA
jgi:hypothetical protein